MDPTNPLSVAPPRYKYHPNPETITYFPAYHSESDAEQQDEEDQGFSDAGSDFSDEEDQMPDIERTEKQSSGYDESSVNIEWRKGHDEGALKGVKQTLVAVNQVAVILTQALDKSSRARTATTTSFQKIGHVTLRKPLSADSSKAQRPRKVFSLWVSKSDSSSTLLAVQVGRISDRAVHIVSKTLVNQISSATADTKVEILDTYIPQTYVSSAQPISQLYLDYPPIRYLATNKSIVPLTGSSAQSTRGVERYESPNYVIGISAGLLNCLARSSLESVLLLVPKPVDGQSIVQAIGATSTFAFTANTLETVLRGADLDWEDVNYPAAGAGQKGRPSGRRDKGKEYGMIGDGGMYV